MTWRLITDGELPGARNMARDVAILEAVSTGSSPPTVRLYGWDPPCVSLGKHQGTDAADLEFCREHGIDVVRRPTGGRALLHHLELTYSVVAPLGVAPMPSALQDAYRLVCGALVLACRRLGVEAELTGGDIRLHLPSPTSTVPCFDAPADGEVVAGGRKLVGSAMRAHGGAILQHGAILLDWDGRLQAGALGLPDDSSLRSKVTNLAAELGRPVHRRHIERPVVDAVADHLGVSVVSGDLSDLETRRETQLEAACTVQVGDGTGRPTD